MQQGERDCWKQCGNRIPILVAHSLSQNILPPSSAVQYPKVQSILPILQAKVFEIDQVVNDLVSHHQNGAGCEDIQLPGLKGLPALLQQNQNADHSDHIENVCVAHHAGAPSKSRCEQQLPASALFRLLV